MRKFSLLLAVTVGLIGCGSPGIAGKWNMTGAAVPEGSKLVTEFAGNTFTSRAEINQGGALIKFEFSGDYTYDGKKLKLVGKTVKVDESSFPSMAKAMIPQFKTSLEKSVLAPQEGDAKLEGDTMTFTVNGQTTTFTRVK
ncbi:MAG: hypothetical protein WCI55_08170 [Armatimonadota bacterium]